MVVDSYHVLLALTLFALAVFPVFIALCFFGARRIVRVDDPASPERARTLRDGVTPLPGVSIMKPCAGADDDLERCIESFCALNYPTYQIVLGVRDASDAAYPILMRVKARHPEVDIDVVITGNGRHPSPKVNNLEGMAARMKHPVIWLSDSNTRVHPDTLWAMVEDLHAPNVGLVVSPVASHDEQTMGSAAESLQLTAYIAQWTFIAHGVVRMMIAPGKSSVLRRETLDAIGGWDELGKYFGEDFILFERVRERGQRVELGRHAIANVSVRTTVKRFLVRHLRWMQIRWRVTPSALIEPILTPIVPAALFLLVCPGLVSLGLFAFSALVQLAGDLVVLARLRGAHLALRLWPMVLIRPFLATWLWMRAMFDRRVEWRGNQFWMGSQSRLLTEPPLRARLRAVRDALRAG